VRLLLRALVVVLALLLGGTPRLPSALWTESYELSELEGDGFVHASEPRIESCSKSKPRPKGDTQTPLFHAATLNELDHQRRPTLPRGRASAHLPRRVAFTGDPAPEPDGARSA
jgi:hypothetical protein